MSFMSGLKGIAKRNLNFKSLVKIGTYASGMIPGVGGAVQSTLQNLQDAAQAKKEQRQADSQAAVQAAADTAGTTGGTILGQFVAKTAKKTYDAASDEVKAGSGQVGAAVVDSTIKEWFKQHWSIVASIVGGILALVFVLPRLMHHSPSQRAKKHYKY